MDSSVASTTVVVAPQSSSGPMRRTPLPSHSPNPRRVTMRTEPQRSVEFDWNNLPIPEDLFFLSTKEYESYSSWCKRIQHVLAIQQRLHPDSGIFPMGHKEKDAVYAEAKQLNVYKNKTLRSWEQSLCHDKKNLRMRLEEHDRRDVAFNRLPHTKIWAPDLPHGTPKFVGIVVEHPARVRA